MKSKDKVVIIGYFAIILIFALITIKEYRRNFIRNDNHENWANHNYGMNLMMTLEPNSILFTEGGDNQVFSLAYHQMAENMRMDSDVYDQKGNVFKKIYGDLKRVTPQQLDKIKSKVDKEILLRGRPVYFTWRRPGIETIGDWYLRPYGILFKALPAQYVLCDVLRYEDEIDIEGAEKKIASILRKQAINSFKLFEMIEDLYEKDYIYVVPHSVEGTSIKGEIDSILGSKWANKVKHRLMGRLSFDRAFKVVYSFIKRQMAREINRYIKNPNSVFSINEYEKFFVKLLPIELKRIIPERRLKGFIHSVYRGRLPMIRTIKKNFLGLGDIYKATGLKKKIDVVLGVGANNSDKSKMGIGSVILNKRHIKAISDYLVFDILAHSSLFKHFFSLRMKKEMPTPFNISDDDYWKNYFFAWKKAKNIKNWDYLVREILTNYNYQLGDYYKRKAQNLKKKYRKQISAINKEITNLNKKIEKLKNDKSKIDSINNKIKLLKMKKNALLIEIDEMLQKSKEYFNLAMKVGYDMSAVYHNMGIMDLQRKDWASAKKKFEKAIEVYDESITTYKVLIEQNLGYANALYRNVNNQNIGSYSRSQGAFIKMAKKYLDKLVNVLKRRKNIYTSKTERYNFKYILGQDYLYIDNKYKRIYALERFPVNVLYAIKSIPETDNGNMDTREVQTLLANPVNILNHRSVNKYLKGLVLAKVYYLLDDYANASSQIKDVLSNSREIATNPQNTILLLFAQFLLANVEYEYGRQIEGLANMYKKQNQTNTAFNKIKEAIAWYDRARQEFLRMIDNLNKQGQGGLANIMHLFAGLTAEKIAEVSNSWRSIISLEQRNALLSNALNHYASFISNQDSKQSASITDAFLSIVDKVPLREFYIGKAYYLLSTYKQPSLFGKARRHLSKFLFNMKNIDYRLTAGLQIYYNIAKQLLASESL